MPLPPDIIERVLKLTDDDRIELVSVLLDALENSGGATDYVAVWAADIEARSDAVHAGKANLRDLEAVMAQARERLVRGTVK